MLTALLACDPRWKQRRGREHGRRERRLSEADRSGSGRATARGTGTGGGWGGARQPAARRRPGRPGRHSSGRLRSRRGSRGVGNRAATSAAGRAGRRRGADAAMAAAAAREAEAVEEAQRQRQRHIAHDIAPTLPVWTLHVRTHALDRLCIPYIYIPYAHLIVIAAAAPDARAIGAQRYHEHCSRRVAVALERARALARLCISHPPNRLTLSGRRLR